jgi:two-component system KDP operon response regulator KdpE
MGLGWRFAKPSFAPTEAASRYSTELAAAPVSVCFYLHRCDRDNSRVSTRRRIRAMTQQNILVVDDERPMRRLLASNLRASGYAVRSAADGSEALKLLEEHRFDLLLLDINIPGPNGLQVLETARRDTDIPVLIVSGRGRERDRVGALELGADDYLSKPFGVSELVARVNALLRRVTPGRKEASSAYRYKGLAVDFDARRVLVNEAEVRLTKREFEVLAYLARNAGKVMLHRQVLLAVWGGQYGNESDYIWTFVQRIRRKIEPDRMIPRYILTELGVGYRMPPPDDQA